MILHGDALAMLKTLPDESVQCCVTSPPYFRLRDYQIAGQIGMERTPGEYIGKLVQIFAEVHRILRSDGTIFLNIGDSYCNAKGTAKNPGGRVGPNQCLHSNHKDAGAIPLWRPNKSDLEDPDWFGAKSKDVLGIPWLLALALRSSGYWLRSPIIWAKPNGMPTSQEDRPTSSHEYVFLFSKSARYFSDFDAIKTPPRESSLMRLAQDIQMQAGSHRANGGGKTNGPMKAVRGSDKQRGHSRQHAGFNERWDEMSREEQQSTPAMMRDVWFISPEGYDQAHFAVMPRDLARRCILAGSREGDTILDPFAGSGTTLEVAKRLGRKFIGIELNEKYIETLIKPRLDNIDPLFAVNP